MVEYFFTIFTPTYNRAYRLNRLFASLQKQSFNDFEWLILDDGSTDNTSEVVEQFVKEARFPIVYHKMVNGGKHRATNVGAKLARGKWFANVDSDDWLEYDALEIIKSALENVESHKHKMVSMVLTLDRFANGGVIGQEFPCDLRDYIDMEYRDISGDKFIILFTDFLRATPFEEFCGENFITEGSLFIKYIQKYINTYTLFINKPLYVVEYLSDGLTHNSIIFRINAINGCLYSYLLFWRSLKWCKKRCKFAINYYRFLFHGKKRRVQFDTRVVTKEIPLVFSIFGYILYLKDMLKLSIK